MGLDSVELVMEFEDEFEISIPDDDAEVMLTIGDAVRYIAAATGVSPSDADAMQDIRHRLCKIVAHQMDIDFAVWPDDTRFATDLGVT